MELHEKIQELKHAAHLSAARKAELKARLMHMVEARAIMAERAAEGRSLGEGARARHGMRPTLIPVFASLLVVALLGGGTAAAAENTRPGDLLYPVKVGVNEKMKAVLAFTDEARADAEARFAEKRIVEASELAAEGKLAAGLKADLETRFNVHADRVEVRIERLRERGNVVAAAELASRFEASLKAHETILARVAAKSSSTGVVVAALETEVNDALEAVTKIRADLDDDVEAANGKNPKVEMAARGRAEAAANAIAASQNFVAIKRVQLGPRATVEAEARLDEAAFFKAEADQEIASGDYSEAFVLAGDALRTAQHARLLVRAVTRETAAAAVGATDSVPGLMKPDLMNNASGSAANAENQVADDGDEGSVRLETNVEVEADLRGPDIESKVEGLLKLGL